MTLRPRNHSPLVHSIVVHSGAFDPEVERLIQRYRVAVAAECTAS